MTKRNFISSAPKPMRKIFQEVNLTDSQAYQMAYNVWGNLNPDIVWHGADDVGKGLTDQHYEDAMEVVQKLASDLYPLERKRGEEIVQKATTSTTVSVLIPEFIDPKIIDVVNRETPFLATAVARGMRGKTVNVPRRTAGITPEFLADSGGAITANDHTFGDINVDVRYLYAGGEITYPGMAVTQEQADVKKEVIQKTFLDLQRFKEQVMLRGINTAGTEDWNGYLSADSNGYDGLFKRVHEDASSNETELAGSASIGIGDIDDSVETVLTSGGRPDYGVCDFNTAKVIMQTARSYRRFSENTVNIGDAIGRFTVDQTPFFATNQLPTAQNQKSFAIIDKRAIERRTLMPDRFREVGQNLKDTYEFYWVVYETFVVAAPEWVSTVNGGA